MSSLLMLLLFCDFLENRLQTSSLALLRRIFSDFFAGNERTLLDFVRLGASIVTVMPMERTSASHRQEAARLLNQQVQLMVNYNEQNLQLSVFHYLSVRVATKNISWLRSMFLEFCGGNDSLLRQFVRRGNEVISVIPVDNQALPRQPMSLEMNPPVFPSMPTPHLMRPQALQEEQNQQYQCSEPGEDESESDDDNEINNVNELVSREASEVGCSAKTILDGTCTRSLGAQVLGTTERNACWKSPRSQENSTGKGTQSV
uniref:Rho-GAP domain-containing protein n=1 Tax=Phytophthora ramorum TaxID=164328 RepID=H3GPD9_PHYRM